MKIYSQKFELSSPADQKFWVPQHSDFKIGIRIELNGQEAPGSFKLMLGETEIQADQSKTDGYFTYTMKSDYPAAIMYSVQYTATEDSETQYFKIYQTTTDSTVFEVGGEGGGSTPEGNFVKSVNGEYPVNSNVDVSKLKIENDGWLTGDTIMQSLDNIDDQLALKADLTAIVPVAPSTSAAEDKIAGAKSTAEFVNSSIATNTANFKGTFTSEDDFPADATNNDYLFLTRPTMPAIGYSSATNTSTAPAGSMNTRSITRASRPRNGRPSTPESRPKTSRTW